MRFDTLDSASALARDQLTAAYKRLLPRGSVNVTFGGQLLRPVLSIVGGGRAECADERFWYGALAVQLAHEASLVHDDVVDNASTRREAPTVFASKGVAAAVLEGDMLLTAAYVAAAGTRSVTFMSQFAGAVQRTVMAERLQGSRLGTAVDAVTYERIAVGKAGELMGCALAAAAMVSLRDGEEHAELGREIGLLYQMMDDLLDYCPAANTGKPAMSDYGQGRWTWPLDELPGAQLGFATEDLLGAFNARHSATDSSSPLTRAADRLRMRIASVAHRGTKLMPGDTLLPAMFARWGATIDDAVRLQQAARAASARVSLSDRCNEISGWAGGEAGYLAHHSRSFRFASRLLPRAHSQRIARVYAFCRFTDDLVDEPTNSASTSCELLGEWVGLARASYHGQPTGLTLLDTTMSEMRSADVPFDHVVDLCRGMRMDLDATTYETLDDLRVYTYRVAGVVGLWIAQLAGVQDPRALLHAERMGHAMQLTNILRDVGDDWRRGRLYLPRDVLARHGLEPQQIGAMANGSRIICDSYRGVIRELMEIAEADYRSAFAWLPSLPAPLQPGMAVAAELYEAIHTSLQANDYDNLHKRASTSPVRKIVIAAHALRSLRRARTVSTEAQIDVGSAPTVFNHGWQA